MRIPADYMHNITWEYKKRSEEQNKIEDALKEAHIALYEYRDKITQLKEENDNLLIKQGENSRAIKDLLALNNSVEQHVHFSEGAECNKLSSYVKTHKGNNIHQRDKENIKGIINCADDTPKVDHKFNTPNVIRTVYLENSDIVELRNELDQLQNQILEEKAEFDVQLHNARNERAQLDEYARQEFISDNAKIESLMKELEDIDQLAEDTMIDYVQLLKENDSKIREKEEYNEQLRLENAKLMFEIQKVQEKSKKELERAEKEYERATQEYGDVFKQQSDQQSRHIKTIKQQYEKVQKSYRNKNDILIDSIEKAKMKLQKTEARRSLQLGGYYEDLRLLDKKCSFYENYTNKLKMLVEEDAKKMLERLRKENHDDDNNEGVDDYIQQPGGDTYEHYGEDVNEEPHPDELQQMDNDEHPEED